jgi:hypothetical protein
MINNYTTIRGRIFLTMKTEIPLSHPGKPIKLSNIRPTQQGQTMTYFLRRGTSFKPTAEANIDIHTTLPAGTFMIKQDAMTDELFFDRVSDFELPTKMYGTATKNADRIMNTFLDRSASTGVLLNGEKGSGKSLLAKTLAVRAHALDIPTIVINHPWVGDDFNQLIQSVAQPCVVLFDEFEKVYDSEDQQKILTLLDGVFPSKKLYVLTCNDKYKVDYHMRNRPGRLYYMIDYEGLEREFIVEYCQDVLNAKQYIGKICEVASLFENFNFDMLKALVEEMNRYGETPYDALDMLNIKPSSHDGGSFTVQVTYKGKPAHSFWPDNIDYSPLNKKEIRMHYYKSPKDDDATGLVLDGNNLVKIDNDGATMVYVKGDITATFTRKVTPPWDYREYDKYFDGGKSPV